MRLDYMIRWDLKGVAVRSWQLPILKAMNGFVSWLANSQLLRLQPVLVYVGGRVEQIEFIFRKPAG